MPLFEIEQDPHKNLLPKDGAVYYYGKIMSDQLAEYYLARLLTHIVWKYDEAIIFGKRIITKRKVAWYGDQAFKYAYSKTSKYALPWTDELLALKKMIEAKTGERFNSCLLNLYHTGAEGMAWHSDAEIDLKQGAAIASLSFGALRKFVFKHKLSQEKVELVLEHGSLLLMKENTQTHWLHRLPPTQKVHSVRVNLTFRTIEDFKGMDLEKHQI